MNDLFPDETIYETMIVVGYEVGDMFKSVFYLKKRGLREASIAEAKKAIGDLIVQLKIVCARLGLDFEEVEEQGFWQFMDWFSEMERRMKDAKKDNSV